MNKSIRRVAAALGVLFLAIFVNLNIQQIALSKTYRDKPGNQRTLYAQYAIPRGDITVGGTAVAHSKATSGTLKYLRVYPDGAVYAPVTGFYSISATPSTFLGTTGIETAESSVLSGDDSRLFGTRLTDLLTGRNPRGGSIELTLDKASQQAAYDGMIKSDNGKPRRGAVVAINPQTGAILAAVSTPSYDPSSLSLHNGTQVTKNYSKLIRNPSQPLLNRAFNQVYPPGSTFKVVVSAAALKYGIKPDQKLIAPNGYYPESGKTASSCPTGSVNCIENFGGETCDGGQFATLAFSLAKSCNTTFAALAVEQLGGKRIADQAKLFGFDPSVQQQIPLPVASSTVGTQTDLNAKGFLARTAFGQQDVRMTPLQGAMIASAVANDGTLMQPYLVARELAPNLDELAKTEPTQLDQVIDPTLDQQLQTMMEGVVTAPEGTGHEAAISGVVVGGKTGTADTGRKLPNGQDEAPDAWFIGYAIQNGVPKIAVAVIIENGGVNGNETTGGEAAAPVARAVMQAYLNGHPGDGEARRHVAVQPPHWTPGIEPGTSEDRKVMTQPRLVGGRYELGDLIGYGGMAEVHRGRDIRLGRDVAIKVLRADLARDPSFLNRFRREAQSAAGLNHPSIVSVYDTGEDVGAGGTTQPYIVMEFVAGRTLRDILKSEGRLPARRAMEITADVSAALDFSHRAGLVHRDVKPANVMITQTGAVKVMDFGIARAVADNSATVTQTANVIGTAQYLSPEQARGEQVDARSDVYSTGCLLYELVTGVPPFQGDSPVAVAYQHVRENPAMPSSRVPGLPRALDSIVMKALAKNPQNRYQSAAEMRGDLQRALANQPVSAEAVMTDAERTQFIARTPPPPVALPHRDMDDSDHERERRNAVIWAAIVIALLLVVGAGAFFIWKLGSSSDSTKKVTIPNLVGLRPPAAAKQLGNTANCSETNANNPCKVYLVANSEAPTTPGPCDDGSKPTMEGVICKVTDQAGNKVPANSDITQGSTLLYSVYKKDIVNVPYVLGLSFQQAADALKNANLQAKQGTPINTFDKDAGQVAKQFPKYNVAVSPNSTVTLHLSTGKAKLPDVTKMKEADARAELNRDQFVNIGPNKTKTGHDQSKDGTVVAMNPTPGNPYPADVQITLTVYHYTEPPPTCDSNPTTPSPTPVTSTSVDPSTSATVTTTTTPTPSPTGSNGLPVC